jgi:hypothetical protein
LAENFTVAGNPCASVSKFVADPYPPEARLPVRVSILSSLLLVSFASAQAPAPNHQVLPFTGRVLDADSHKPIPGARIHYLDDNPPIDRNGNPVRGIVSGDVTSAQDGSFALPADLPLATYEVTVIAFGYYASEIYDSQEFIGEKLPSGFVHPNHVFQLRRSHDPVAIGASEINGA